MTWVDKAQALILLAAVLLVIVMILVTISLAEAASHDLPDHDENKVLYPDFGRRLHVIDGGLSEIGQVADQVWVNYFDEQDSAA